MAAQAAHARPRAGATRAGRAHIAALEAWSSGDIDRAIGVWEGILSEHPHDVLAFRLAHFNNFWLGRPGPMAASAERVLPRWSAALPGYGSVLACLCFALEECGNVRRGRAGRAAGGRARPRRHVGGARGRAHHGDAGPARGGDRLAQRTGAATGRVATTCSIICGGTARCSTWSAATRRGAGAVRPAVPQPRRRR